MPSQRPRLPEGCSLGRFYIRSEPDPDALTFCFCSITDLSRWCSDHLGTPRVPSRRCVRLSKPFSLERFGGHRGKSLEHLSAEIRQIALAIDDLAGEPPTECYGPIDPGKLRAIAKARHQRQKFLPAWLFGEPAWDMLIDLLIAELEQQSPSVSDLCHASGVPHTTALRWIQKMEAGGLVMRVPDKLDQRRQRLQLSEAGLSALRDYFAAIEDTPL